MGRKVKTAEEPMRVGAVADEALINNCTHARWSLVGMLNCSLIPPIRPTVFITSVGRILTLLALLPHGMDRLQQFSLVMPSLI